MESATHPSSFNSTQASGLAGELITNASVIKPFSSQPEGVARRVFNTTGILLQKTDNESFTKNVNGSNIFQGTSLLNSSNFDRIAVSNETEDHRIAKGVKQILFKGFRTNLETTTRYANASEDIISYVNTETNKDPGTLLTSSLSDGAIASTTPDWETAAYGKHNNSIGGSYPSVFHNITSSVPSDATSALKSVIKKLTDELSTWYDPSDPATDRSVNNSTLNAKHPPTDLELWTKRFVETSLTDHFRDTVSNRSAATSNSSDFTTNIFNNVTDLDDGTGVGGTAPAINASSPASSERLSAFFNIPTINNPTSRFNDSAEVTNLTADSPINITTGLYDGARSAVQGFTESIKELGAFFSSTPTPAGELNKHHLISPVDGSSVNSSSSGLFNFTSITPPTTLPELASETLTDSLTHISLQQQQHERLSTIEAPGVALSSSTTWYDQLQHTAGSAANTFLSSTVQQNKTNDWSKPSGVITEILSSVVYNVTGSFTEALSGNASSFVTERLKENISNTTWTGQSAVAPSSGQAASQDGVGVSLDVSTLADLMCSNSTWCLTAIPDYANVTNGTEESDVEIRFWLLFLLFIPLLTIFGNVLVCLSVFKEKSLQHVTNYFIVSLAVADILVAFLVMPPAVFYEVRGLWMLSDVLCDAWVSFDVMFSTASILNLVAISVDRFIAVTQPIKYAKHKNSKRVYVTLALVWVISVAIGLPIALGQNYSPLRGPHECRFYNSDFLIWSSMGSFYIPCIIMVFLYWRIFRAIRQRGKKAKKMTRANVIENPAQHDDSSDEKKPLKQDQNQKLDTQVELANLRTTSCTVTTMLTPLPDEEEEEVWVRMEDAHAHVALAANDGSHVIANSTAETTLIDTNNKSTHLNGKTNDGNIMVQSYTSDSESTPNSPERQKLRFFKTAKNKLLCRNGSLMGDASQGNGHGKKHGLRPHIKVNFPLSRRKTKREGSRERKATKTLAIVLGVFLFCWVPFFTMNIINAICIRYQLKQASVCNSTDGLLFSLFTWLGYVNSFMNPVIYTVFNMDFRKAFKKLLMNPCAKY